MQEVVVLALSLHICLTEQPGFKSRGLYRITDSQIHCIVFSPAPWLQYYQTETWPQNAWLVYQLPHWAIINHSRVLLGLWGKLKRSVPTQHLVAPWGTLQLPVCGVAASQQCHLWHAGTVRCMWHARRPGLCSCVSLPESHQRPIWDHTKGVHPIPEWWANCLQTSDSAVTATVF